MSLLDRLIPRVASNDYRGGKLPLYTFCALAVVMLGRSLIHFLKDDSGVNAIATLVTFAGTPDPDRVIYLFSSLWGSQQLILVLLYAVVLFRYRNLVPLMYALFIVELFFRMIAGSLHPLTPDYYASTPPGKLANAPLLVLSAVMLALSLRDRPPEAAAAVPAASQ